MSDFLGIRYVHIAPREDILPLQAELRQLSTPLLRTVMEGVSPRQTSPSATSTPQSGTGLTLSTNRKKILNNV